MTDNVGMSDSDDSGATTVPDDPSAEGLPPDRPRSIMRKIIGGFFSYGVVLLALWFLFTQMSGQDVSSAVALISPGLVVLFLALGVVNLATNWPPITAGLPGLRIREAAVTNTASAALSNTVPEGGAVATGLNFAMLRSWGFRLDDITAEVLLTGTWSQMTKYVLLSAALVLVWLQGWGPAGLGWAALIVSVLVAIAFVVLVLVLSSERFAHRLGRVCDDTWHRVTSLVRRPSDRSFGGDIDRFRKLSVGLIRFRWSSLTVTTAFSQFTAFAVLFLAVRLMGFDRAQISAAVILLAYSAVLLASLLIPTPGGLGVAELVLVGVLGYGLPTSAQAALMAAVLLYRLATFLVPIPIGLVTYLYWRRSKSWRRPVDSRPVMLPSMNSVTEPVASTP
ncbi:MAG: YbhN family protein [Candidatus Nanopelagicales bacterium]